MARQAKHVAWDVKAMVQDCQWLQQLHSYGLLRAAFSPPKTPFAAYATLQRHRKNLVRIRGDVDSAHAEGSQRNEPTLASRAE